MKTSGETLTDVKFSSVVLSVGGPLSRFHPNLQRTLLSSVLASGSLDDTRVPGTS